MFETGGLLMALGAAGQLASGLMAADARKMEFAEQMRALQQKRDFTISLARTKGNASGIEPGSVSTTSYLSKIATEFDQQLGYLRRAKKVTNQMDLLGAYFGFAGNMASAAGKYGAANNWGQG